MKARLYVAAAVVAFFLGGCEFDEYEIEITPRGKEFQRKLSAWHVKPEEKGARKVRLPDEKLTALAKLYEKRLTTPDDVVQTFVGTFKGRTPNDVGGAGSYTRLDSRMGHACAYVERFRGRDEQAGLIEERLKKSDKLVDHLAKWFESELAGEDGLKDLLEFVAGDFRRDLKNITTYSWMSRIVKAHGGQDVVVRILQYLAERGYFSPEDLPRITRGIIEGQESTARLLSLLQRFIATKMGVPKDKPIPKALAFLADGKAAEKSLEAYLRTTAEFKDRLAKWEEQKKKDPKAERPGPMDVLEPPDIDPIFGVSPFGPAGTDQLSLKLTTDSAPWLTNGEWDAKSREVQWATGVKADKDLPALCYALWSRPDEPFQKNHFGKVVLAGGDLALYCLWRESLRRQEARQWRAFIAGLKPGPDLKKTLAAFRFSGEPPEPPQAEGEKTKTYAKAVIDLISSHLTPSLPSSDDDETRGVSPRVR